MEKHPYWWDAGTDNQPLNLELLAKSAEAIPSQADCVVVGAGYSGLSAALTLARAGRSVIVLDSAQPGYGCSGRKAALKMLGDPEGSTPLDDLTFATRPLYSGRPWFLPALRRWHSLLDRFGY